MMLMQDKIADQTLLLKDVLPVIIPVVGTIVVAIIGAVLGYIFGTKAQLAATKKERRQLAYSQLLGHEAIISQLLVSRFEAFANSDYQEALWRLDGSAIDSLDLQESQRWMRKSEDLALEVAQSRQRLYETLGLVRTVFKPNQCLRQKLQKIEKHKMPIIARCPFGGTRVEIEAWILKVIPELQALVESEFSNPMRELASCLQIQIESDAQ